MSNYDLLNPMQKEAVFATEGPLLVLAGAGSGKTRVLTHRIAYLIEEKKVNPWNILAITFTNKAAQEMRDRVDKLVSFGADSIWVSTFHSACVRILRRHIEFLGYSTHFTIYDSDDQKTLLKQIYKTMGVDHRMYKERSVLAQISSAKDRLIDPDEFTAQAGVDFYQRRVGEIYQEYQKALKKNDALDFDDLIVKTVELFQTEAQVLEYYQERFRYILVDEYQDTNRAQFELIRLLASKYKNICVVGDDDQSIYKFRGADIGNILNFEDAFPGTRVVKLEQNYRSTQNILDAANEVIKNNCGRKEKSLWTANGTGEKLTFRQFDQAYEEADYIIRDIVNKGYAYQDCAVLYRTNAQSRLLEEKCIAYNVPYRLIGGVNFYQRKEIKDILSYLKVVANGNDDLAAARIVNVPKRGIGASSVGKVTVFAAVNGYSLYDAMTRARVIPGLGKSAEKFRSFTDMIETFRRRLAEGLPADSRESGEEREEAGSRPEGDRETGGGMEAGREAGSRSEGDRGTGSGMEAGREADSRPEADRETGGGTEGSSAAGYSIRQLIEDILEETGYRKELEGDEDSEGRLQNIEELVNKAVAYTESAETPTLDGFLEEVALVADIDQLDQSENRVTLMTFHGAKGLEFEHVYLSGMEEGLFPSYMSITSDEPGDLEEERRLCYVGITRAKKDLTLTCARMRMVNGQTHYSKNSRFLEEIPKELLSGEKLKPRLSFEMPEDSKSPFFESEGGGGISPRTAKKTRPEGTSRFAPNSKPSFGKVFEVTKSPSAAFHPGDRVNHIKFGEGTVMEVKEGARDYEVTVEFDTVGTRRILASFLKSKLS